VHRLGVIVTQANHRYGAIAGMGGHTGKVVQGAIGRGIQLSAGAQWLQPRQFVGWQKGRWHEKVGRQKRNAPKTRGGATGVKEERNAVLGL
jgi:hypothetical protein